jgi:hypothetical protein
MIDFHKYSKNFLTSPDNSGCVNGCEKYDSETCQAYVNLVRIAFQKKKFEKRKNIPVTCVAEAK